MNENKLFHHAEATLQIDFLSQTIGAGAGEKWVLTGTSPLMQCDAQANVLLQTALDVAFPLTLRAPPRPCGQARTLNTAKLSEALQHVFRDCPGLRATAENVGDHSGRCRKESIFEGVISAH